MLPVNVPDDIIHHIQSLMNFKDAARSALLSTRLYDSWYNSRQLILDDRAFRNSHAFWFGAKKTIRRYTVNGLKLESITLYLSCGYERYYDCRKLLQEAAELGVSEISIFLSNENFNFMIPFTVLSSPHLLKFRLEGGALHVGHEIPLPAPSLQTLILLPNRSIGYRGDFIHNIVYHCPALVHLTCTGLLLFVNIGRLKLGSHDLQTLVVHNLNYNQNIYLKELILFFKCLKSLSIVQVLNGDLLQICSESLEELTIHDRFREVSLFARLPNLKLFNYVGVSSSRFTFQSPEYGWRSAVNILCYVCDDYWFHSLRMLIQNLVNSRIKLHVSVIYDTHGAIGCYKGSAVPIAIESVELVACSPKSQIVESLLSVCLPDYLHYQSDSDVE